MYDSPRLYNSRIIDNYLRLLQKGYPSVPIPALLDYAGIKPYQVPDPGHWFTQEQVDRFHDRLVDLSGNPDIAREAGRYVASSGAMGGLRHYFLGMLGPANTFAIISKAASRVTRSALYTSRRLGTRTVEVTVSPYPGVDEKEFQCKNRLGWFEAIVRMFDDEIEAIDHPQCLFRGDPVCRYVLRWKKSPPCFWKKVRNLGILGIPPLMAASLVTSFPVSVPSLFMGGGLALALLSLLSEKEEKRVMRGQIARIREEADQALVQIGINYDNAVLTNEVGRTISQETNISAVLERVLALLSERLEFDRVMVFLADRTQTRLELHAAHGISEEALAKVRNLPIRIDFSEPQGLLTEAFLKQEAVLVSGVDGWRELFTPGGFQLVRELEAESFLFCPIVCNGSSLGIMAADRKGNERPLIQTDLALAQGVAAYIGIALRNADLLETMAGQLEQIRVRDEELIRHRENLEEEVTLRTVQLQAAMQAAREANNAKSEFLANMSHEIRTPLHGVLGLNEHLLESGLSPEQARLARQMHDCAETLLGVISDILDFSKIEANKMELEEVGFDLPLLVGDVLALFRPQAAAKGISLSFSLSGLPEWTAGDPLRLSQVLRNLVGNAVKFTGEGSVNVSVFADPKSRTVRFVVEDTGIGIAQGQIETIFESFHQADGSTSRRYGGSGLGTAIARKLVGLMGGEIGCESTLGKGSTFWFQVPLAPAPRPVCCTGETDGRGTTMAGKRSGHVLVVEDTPVNREIIRLQLEGAGYSVALAEEGEAALAALRERPADLIVMDIQMPGMNGYEAARRIRQGEGGGSNARVPILAMTANATASCRQGCFDAGMNGVLVKPVRKEKFLAAVGRYVSSPNPPSLSPPSAEGITTSDEPLSFNELSDEFGVSGAPLRQLLATFIDDVRQAFARMEVARGEGDVMRLSRLAHGLKGTSAMFFAHPLANAAERLEKSVLCADGDLEPAYENLGSELQRVREAWRRWDETQEGAAQT